MYMWRFDGDVSILTELRLFKTWSFWAAFYIIGYGWSLRIQLLPQFSMNPFQTMHTFRGHNEDVHVEVLYGDKIDCDKIMSF